MTRYDSPDRVTKATMRQAIRLSALTSDGPAVALRLPLAQPRIPEAIGIPTRRASVLPGGRLFHVVEIIGEEEIFLIRRIEADRVLAQPRRVKFN